MEQSIRIQTEIPGPKSREWIARKEAVVANAKTLVVPIFVERASGATLTDVDGNTFLDFAGGIGCLTVGHSNAAVTQRVHEQVDRFLHTDFTIVPYDSYVELAERLAARVPISGPVKAAFFNSGAEAIENAVKIARSATGRPAVIGFTNAFHGRTLMALTLTSKIHPYKAGFGPYAAPARSTRLSSSSSAPTPFGIDGFDTSVLDEAGAPSTAAGAHPAANVTSFSFNTLTDPSPERGQIWPVEPLRDADAELPLGLIGNPEVMGAARCCSSQTGKTRSTSASSARPIRNWAARRSSSRTGLSA